MFLHLLAADAMAAGLDPTIELRMLSVKGQLRLEVVYILLNEFSVS